MHPNFEPDTAFHIYNRANNYENLFIEEKNYTYFLKLLEKYIIPVADIYAYCLMPNHFHLVLKFKKVTDLPEKYKQGKRKLYQAFSDMFNAYAKAINKAYKRRGSLFQKDPKRIIIADSKYLQTVICYVHLNPVYHKFMDDLTNYKHSSYNAIVKNEETIVVREETIGFFDDLDNFIFNHLYRQGLKDLKGIDEDIDENQ